MRIEPPRHAPPHRRVRHRTRSARCRDTRDAHDLARRTSSETWSSGTPCTPAGRTRRPDTASIVALSARGGRCTRSATLSPTIISASSAAETSRGLAEAMRLPPRRMVAAPQSARTSSSLCEMKRTPAPPMAAGAGYRTGLPSPAGQHGGRLIQNDDRRILHQHAQDLDALSLTCR